MSFHLIYHRNEKLTLITRLLLSFQSDECVAMGTKVANPFWLPADRVYAGVPALLLDLESLVNDRSTADVLFVVGSEEIPLYAHKLVLSVRCQSYQYLRNDLMEGCEMKRKMTTITLPYINPVLFTDILHYIYTGKIELEESSVFEMLKIACTLNISHLQTMCEGFIIDVLSVNNACHFLNAAIQMPGPQNTSDFGERESLVERCAVFVEKNAEEVVKTDSFVQLSRDSLLRLIQSDQFALSEEDVWRCVLHWAKHQAGVNKPTFHWSDEDRRKVCQHLSGVINHVKLLLIDSTVFAEEVEPTGAVPMELSLERYRFAAVPGRFDKDVDKRLRPRVCNKFFSGSEILKEDNFQFQQVLNNWYGKSKQEWKLLYRASRDGYSCTEFHHRCDGYSPTVVLVKSSNGSICGGYSDIAWTSTAPPRGKYVTSERSFLFSLVNTQGLPPSKFDLINKKFAICHHPGFGPIFGAGADLSIASDCNHGMQSYSNFPHSYTPSTSSTVTNILMGEYHFNVLDYEVFTLKQIFSS
ncbi:kelch-like protein diablo [Glandiceps talaboti]